MTAKRRKACIRISTYELQYFGLAAALIDLGTPAWAKATLLNVAQFGPFSDAQNPRARQIRWTPKQDAKLRKLVEAGYTNRQVAARMGITALQVEGRRRRHLGLFRRVVPATEMICFLLTKEQRQLLRRAHKDVPLSRWARPVLRAEAQAALQGYAENPGPNLLRGAVTAGLALVGVGGFVMGSREAAA